MNYLIMMFGSQRDFDLMAGSPPEDFAPMHAFMEAFTTDLVDSGELVDTRGLDAPVHTRRVSQQGGVPVVTDGPYAETEEVLAGYWVVDCESFDRATVIAGRLAGCPSPGDVFANAYCDVRPILDHAPEPEL